MSSVACRAYLPRRIAVGEFFDGDQARQRHQLARGVRAHIDVRHIARRLAVARLGLHPGDVVSAQKVSTGLERIRKQYQKHNRWLAQVSIAEKRYIPETNKVDYTLAVESGPVVEIRAEGFHLSRGTMRRYVPVYEEHALDDDLLNEGRRNLLSYMESRGYFDASVDLRRESDQKQNMLRVIYQIDPGERHKIAKVQIAGNKYFRQDDLRPLLHIHEASVVLSHGRYSQSLLRSDTRDIENLYRANGFSQVKVDTQVEELTFGAED